LLHGPKDPPFWKDRIVKPAEVLEKIKPGMTIFLGTGMAEPRTLVRELMASDRGNLQDLELIQLVSLGDTVSIDERYSRKYRLKTFYSGWVSSDAITAGRVDLIPSRFSRIPWLFKSGAVRIDVAVIQITPPDERGHASLGLGVDVARYAMEQASLVVAEINAGIPRTLGDTFVHVDDFDLFVEAKDPPIYLPRWPVPDAFDRIAGHIASVVEDGSCLSFSIGPSTRPLPVTSGKRSTWASTRFLHRRLMDLVNSGAVTNRRKRFFQGKAVAAYVLGTKTLMNWLDGNALVDFQPIDIVMNPRNIGLNDRFMAILPARKADLTGGIALHVGKGNVTAGAGAVAELFAGAAFSRGGRTIFALPSRDRKGESNILVSIADYPNQFTNQESLDMIVTEHGIAYLTGRTIRERAQALIDIAHPDDRAVLVQKAKDAKLLYKDQIFFAESGHLYPENLSRTEIFKDQLKITFRPIKPSDEDEMRRLFYRFSDQAVYYRYFSRIKTMPHGKMQEYVNVDYRRAMSIVGIVHEKGMDRIIAEGRYVRLADRPYADTAFLVDEAYQGKGISTFLLNMLIRIAREQGGIEGFRADVLLDNKSMLRVFEKTPFPLRAIVSEGTYEIVIPFREDEATEKLRGELEGEKLTK
jgi:acyl-CoA hydrolase/GNAT superfamily N-acetyltransferase